MIEKFCIVKKNAYICNTVKPIKNYDYETVYDCIQKFEKQLIIGYVI